MDAYEFSSHVHAQTLTQKSRVRPQYVIIALPFAWPHEIEIRRLGLDLSQMRGPISPAWPWYRLSRPPLFGIRLGR